jgi:hypothetical protein
VDSGVVAPRVSVGFDGWADVKELWPGEGEQNGIIERSNIPGKTNCFGESVYDPAAVANEEFVATYSDTLTDPAYVRPDVNGDLHHPLGVEVRQTSRTWSSSDFGDFVMVEYRMRNIGSNFLRNLYVGLYVDSDVGPANEANHHVDDIAGFRAVDSGTGDTINIAWIADNDGRSPGISNGPLNCPHISGTYVLVAPGQGRKFSFNWWISNTDVSLDYGPAWHSHADENVDSLGWTLIYGTPVGDRRKYQIMSNGEMDFDQIMTNHIQDAPPQIYRDYYSGQVHAEPWSMSDPSPNAPDIANGYDTRYLLSWGPIGVFDYIDPSGHPVYRLNPGEEIATTMAYVCGPYFHDPNNPQPNHQTIDSSLFNWTGFQLNARRAKYLFDQNYTFQPPVPPNNFRPVGSRNGGAGFAWEPPSLGTVQGYNLYGYAAGVERRRFNPALIIGNTYVVSELLNGTDWTFQIETVDNGWFVSALADTLVRIGAILPVTGLVAQTNGATVFLNWNASNDPTFSNYRVLRKDRLGDSTSFACFVPNFTDQTTLGGHVYYYWVLAENFLGLLSLPNLPIRVLAWSPQNRILLIDETDPISLVDSLRGGVSDAAVDAWYNQILSDLGEGYDIIEQPINSTIVFTFESLSQYDLVIVFLKKVPTC